MIPLKAWATSLSEATAVFPIMSTNSLKSIAPFLFVSTFRIISSNSYQIEHNFSYSLKPTDPTTTNNQRKFCPSLFLLWRIESMGFHNLRKKQFIIGKIAVLTTTKTVWICRFVGNVSYMFFALSLFYKIQFLQNAMLESLGTKLNYTTF